MIAALHVLHWLSLAFPGVAAIVAFFAPDTDASRRRAVFFMALSLASTVLMGAFVWHSIDRQTIAREHLPDGLEVIHTAVVSAATLALLLGMPRRWLEHGVVAALPAAAIALSAAAHASGPLLEGTLWVLPFVAGPLAGGAGVLGRVRRIWAPALLAPLGLLAAAVGFFSPVEEEIVALLLAAGLIARMGVAPMHGWWMQAMQGESRGRALALLLWVGHPGALVVARGLGVHLDVHPIVSSILLGVGLCAALAAALIALVQRDLWRLIGLLGVSQAGLQLAGLSSEATAGVAGAIMLNAGKGLALIGLSLVVAAVESRTGTTDMRRLGGLHSTMPVLSLAMVLLGVASAGFPGGLAFVGEDLLIHGVYEDHPIAAGAVIVATSMNGIAIVQAWMRTCLGTGPALAHAVPAGRDLVREQLASILVGTLVLMQGLLPGPTVTVCTQAAERATAVRPVTRTEQ